MHPAPIRALASKVATRHSISIPAFAEEGTRIAPQDALDVIVALTVVHRATFGPGHGGFRAERAVGLHARAPRRGRSGAGTPLLGLARPGRLLLLLSRVAGEVGADVHRAAGRLVQDLPGVLRVDERLVLATAIGVVHEGRHPPGRLHLGFAGVPRNAEHGEQVAVLIRSRVVVGDTHGCQTSKTWRTSSP